MVKFFNEDEERNSQFQVEAFLAYWLSYFAFLSPLEDGLHSYAFSLAVLLAKGNKLALAPLYLASLYVRLYECSWSLFGLIG